VLRLLRRRDFGLLWLGGLVSVAGDWVLNAALPFFVYQQTGSTVATAGMIVAELAPQVLLGTVAGVYVDRWDRKRVLVAANVLQGATVALLLLVPGHGWLWLVFAVAAVRSSVAAFALPAESALLPGLVGDLDLLAANALNALNNRLGRLAGVPLGGALLAFLGLEAVVLVDCASFAVAAVLIAGVRAPRRPAPEAGESGAEVATSAWKAFRADWLDGLGILRRERTIAVLFFVLGLMTFGGTMLDPLTVAWVRDVLGRGPDVYSWLITAHAASGIAGTLLVGRLATRLTPRGLMGWSSVAAGALLLLKFNLPSLPLALGLSVLGGMTSVASAVGAETMAQQSVRDEYRGRVFGALGAVLGLLSLCGALTGGALAELMGTVTMLNVASCLTVLAGLVVLRALPRGATSRA
jgi:MFS family permease